MTEKPRGETEQIERLKIELERLLSYLKKSTAENLTHLLYQHHIFDTRFLIDSAKVFFDQLFSELRENLEAIKKGARMKEIYWLVGHEGNHAAKIYDNNQNGMNPRASSGLFFPQQAAGN